MRSCSIGWLVFFVLLPGTVWSDVYEWTDKKGRVHYSDEPVKGATKFMKNDPNAKIDKDDKEHSPLNTIEHFQIPENLNEEEDTTTVPLAKAVSPYTSFVITAPAQEGTVFSPEEKVDVTMAVNPQLIQGDTIKLYLDRQLIEIPILGLNVTLTEVYRGEHHLYAEIVDSTGRRIALTPEVTFYLQRPGRRP